MRDTLDLYYQTESQKEQLASVLSKQSIVDAFTGEVSGIVVDVSKMSSEEKLSVLTLYLNDIYPDTDISYTLDEFNLSPTEKETFIETQLEPLYTEQEDDNDVFVISEFPENELYSIYYYPYVDLQDNYSYVRPPVEDLLDFGVFTRLYSVVMYYDRDNQEFVEVAELNRNINPEQIVLSEIYEIN
jgi:hypothetical protein